MFLGNVLFDVTPTFPFIIPLPFPIGNGGFLNVSPEGGLLIASSNSSGGIRLDSLGHGIYGNETFLDSITMADGLTFFTHAKLLSIVKIQPHLKLVEPILFWMVYLM